MYEPIKPISAPLSELENSELKALAEVWKEKREALQTRPEHEEFLKRLKREWAIETGLIERLYNWDRGVTEVLISQGIESSLIAGATGLRREEAAHIQDLIEDQQQAIDILFEFIKGERPFSEHFIRGIHQTLTAHQEFSEAQTPDGQRTYVPLIQGDYKKLPNNPRRPDGAIHEYCPPEIVRDEMQQLISWYNEYEKKTTPEVLSAWLHHRFTQIHPFQDGNGRVARAIATLVFLKAGLFPLVIRDLDRNQYIEALESADEGNLQDLTRLFALRQRDAILKALVLEPPVQQGERAEQVIQSGLKILQDRLQQRRQRLEATFPIADRLCEMAHKRFEELVANLNPQLRDLTPPDVDKEYKAATKQTGNGEEQRDFYNFQIAMAAVQLGYFVNTADYHSWARLTICTKTIFELVVSFHGYGSHTSILAASAFTNQPMPHGDAGADNGTVPRYESLSPYREFFQFNYAEPWDSTAERFKNWLEDALATGLGEWQRSL